MQVGPGARAAAHIAHTWVFPAHKGSSVDQPVIVVTGASSGIGEHTAQQLAARGVRLCLVARRRAELERVQSLIAERGGRSAIYPADLSVDEDVDRCAAAILAG